MIPASGARASGGGRTSRLELGLVAGVGALGFVIGLLVDVVFPNAAYGYQLVAGLAGLLLLLAGVPLWRRRRPLAAIAIVAGAGVLAGIVVGLTLRPGSAAATAVTLDVALDEPAVATLHTTSGTCLVLDERLMLLESADAVALVDGRSVSVTLSQGTYRPAPDASPDGLTVDVHIAWALEDGSPTETWMGSDATSTVVVTGTASEGTVDFSGLVLRPASEQRDPIDVSGSISWSCV